VQKNGTTGIAFIPLGNNKDYKNMLSEHGIHSNMDTNCIQ